MNNKNQQKGDASKASEADEQQQEQPVSDFDNNDGWKEHSDGEVVKLDTGDSIEGLLVDKSISHKYNDCGIYKFQVKDKDVPQVILGSKQLDRMMSNIDINTEVKIVFTGTQSTDKGNPMKIFKVFTKE